MKATEGLGKQFNLMHFLENMIMILKKICQHFQNKKIFDKFIHERCDKILELSEKINYDALTSHFQSKHLGEKILIILMLH